MAKKTFAQARGEILGALASAGWRVQSNLKTPWAESPSGGTRLWFKPQAVWVSHGRGHELGNARSTWTDIRTVHAGEFVIYANTLDARYRKASFHGDKSIREHARAAYERTKSWAKSRVSAPASSRATAPQDRHTAEHESKRWMLIEWRGGGGKPKAVDLFHTQAAAAATLRGVIANESGGHVYRVFHFNTGA